MSNLEYHVPRTVGEALQLMAKYGADAKVIAGGTDLIPKMKAEITHFSHLISLKVIEELKYSGFDAEGNLHIGANTTLRDLEAMPGVKETFPALWEGMHSMANTQIRNRGTVAGNICNAVPSADTAPALLVYEALVCIANTKEIRRVPVEAFFTGVCRTVPQPEELVTEIIVPRPEPTARSIYYKYSIRNALDLAMIGVAANVTMEGSTVKDVKLALGAVAVTPKRATKAEQLLIGQELTEERILEAARIASQEDCSPISDIRATADYRREMVRLHVRDALRYVRQTNDGGTAE